MIQQDRAGKAQNLETKFSFGESDIFSSSSEEILRQSLQNLGNETNLESLTTDLTEEEKSLAFLELERELEKVNQPDNNNNAELQNQEQVVNLQINPEISAQQENQRSQTETEKEEMERQEERQARNQAETEAQKEKIPDQQRKLKLKRLLKKVIVRGRESQALTSQTSNQEKANRPEKEVPEATNQDPENQFPPKTSQDLENLILIERIKALVSHLEESPSKGTFEKCFCFFTFKKCFVIETNSFERSLFKIVSWRKPARHLKGRETFTENNFELYC